jgi:hypothetical protein
VEEVVFFPAGPAKISAAAHFWNSPLERISAWGWTGWLQEVLIFATSARKKTGDMPRGSRWGSSHSRTFCKRDKLLLPGERFSIIGMDTSHVRTVLLLFVTPPSKTASSTASAALDTAGHRPKRLVSMTKSSQSSQVESTGRHQQTDIK